MDRQKQKKLSAKEKEGTTLLTLLILSTNREQRVDECEEDLSKHAEQTLLFNNKKSIDKQSIDNNGDNRTDEEITTLIALLNRSKCSCLDENKSTIIDDGILVSLLYC